MSQEANNIDSEVKIGQSNIKAENRHAEVNPTRLDHEPKINTHSGSLSIGDLNMDRILDLKVTLSVQVGSKSISIQELLQLNQGSVIELDRSSSESIDLLVNGMLVAKGEIVVANDKFGIHLLDIVDPEQRVKPL